MRLNSESRESSSNSMGNSEGVSSRSSFLEPHGQSFISSCKLRRVFSLHTLATRLGGNTSMNYEAETSATHLARNSELTSTCFVPVNSNSATYKKSSTQSLLNSEITSSAGDSSETAFPSTFLSTEADLSPSSHLFPPLFMMSTPLLIPSLQTTLLPIPIPLQTPPLMTSSTPQLEEEPEVDSDTGSLVSTDSYTSTNSDIIFRSSESIFFDEDSMDSELDWLEGEGYRRNGRTFSGTSVMTTAGATDAETSGEYLSLKPRIRGVFTPNLPPELWLLILRFATREAWLPETGSRKPKYGSRAASFHSLVGRSRSRELLNDRPSKKEKKEKERQERRKLANALSYPYQTAYDVISSAQSLSSKLAHSFLTHPPPHDHLTLRLKVYRSLLKWRASLTRVCRLWNVVGQEILWEFVWIACGRDAKIISERLDLRFDFGREVLAGREKSQVCEETTKTPSPVEEKPIDPEKKTSKKKGFEWLSFRTAFFRKGKNKVKSNGEYEYGSSTPSSIPSGSGTKDDNIVVPSLSMLEVIPNPGAFIRRLRIETPSMDRVSPQDVQSVLAACTRLRVFEDIGSIMRSPSFGLGFGFGGATIVGGASLERGPSHRNGHVVKKNIPKPSSYKYRERFEYEDVEVEVEVDNERMQEEAEAQGRLIRQQHQKHVDSNVILRTLFSHEGSDRLNPPPASTSESTRANLRSLIWTNYDHDPEDFSSGLKFYEDIIGSKLQKAGSELEYLEIGAKSKERGFGSGGWGMSFPNTLSGGVGASALLTELCAKYTTTTTITTTASYVSPSSSFPSPVIDGGETCARLSLPSLRSLKVTLDNATFSVLSTWDMPLLTHLSVMSADFGYAGVGFRTFFEVHGAKIVQLELGHSSGDIEEAWITERPVVNSSKNNGIPLDMWCPYLEEFICSADAEWNWQSPDWIAPHVLLPAHTGLSFIGVRDMERRLVGDADEAERRRRSDLGLDANSNASNHGANNTHVGQLQHSDPYFMLLEQFGSLLRRDAFPSLRTVRDMSWESDVMRRTGRMESGMAMISSTSFTAPSPSFPAPSTLKHSPSIPPLTTPPASTSAAKKLLSKASTSHFQRPRQSQQEQRRKRRQLEVEAEAERDALALANGRKVLRFWNAVVHRCNVRGVILEDCYGGFVGKTVGEP